MCQILYLLSERDTVLIRKVTSHNKEQKKKRRGGFFSLVCMLLRALEKMGLFLLESLTIPKSVQALISVLWSLLWRGYAQILLSTHLCPAMPWKAVEFLVTLTDAQFKRDSINSELFNTAIFKTFLLLKYEYSLHWFFHYKKNII